MNVQIVVFPETKVAALEHFGPPDLEHTSVQKLLAWKLEQRLLDPLKHRSVSTAKVDVANASQFLRDPQSAVFLLKLAHEADQSLNRIEAHRVVKRRAHSAN